MCDIHTWELPSSLMFIITTLWSSGKSNVNWAICGAQQCFKILSNHVHISGKEGYSGIFVAGYSHNEHWAVISLSLLLCSWSLIFFFFFELETNICHHITAGINPLHILPLLIFHSYLTWSLFLSFASQNEQDPKTSSFTLQLCQNHTEFWQNHFKRNNQLHP